MRILVTNDDSVHSEGLRILETLAYTISDDVWVVAPETEQSAVSHALSLRRPLRIRNIRKNWYSVDGTPTDCVVIAVKEILKDSKPQLILSGINHGSNLGEDITYSGTVAAAIEGTLLDIPSIAFSQHYQDKTIDWRVAEHYGSEVIKKILDAGIPYNTLINVNFPPRDNVNDVMGVKVVPQGRRKLGDNVYKKYDPKGEPYYWISSMRNIEKDPPFSDFAAINDGFIAITPIHLNLTDYNALELYDHIFAKTEE